MRKLILLYCSIGILLQCGHKPITLEELTIEKMHVSVRGTTLEIAPLEIQATTYTTLLTQGTPHTFGPIHIPHTANQYRALTKGSIHIIRNGDELKEGNDYRVNYDWGTIGAPESSTTQDTYVTITYRYTLSRLDIAVRTTKGAIKLIQGTPDPYKPVLPNIPQDATILFSVYLPHNTTFLTAENINLLASHAKPHPLMVHIQKYSGLTDQTMKQQKAEAGSTKEKRKK